MPTPEEIAKHMGPDIKGLSDEQLLSLAGNKGWSGSVGQDQMDAIIQEMENIIDKIWTHAAHGKTGHGESEFSDPRKYYCGRGQKDLGSGLSRMFWSINQRGGSGKGVKITIEVQE